MDKEAEEVKILVNSLSRQVEGVSEDGDLKSFFSVTCFKETPLGTQNERNTALGLVYSFTRVKSSIR